MSEVTTGTPGTGPAPAKVHPLMPPEELKALWRSVRARWRHDGEAMVREIEAERDAWDDDAPPPARG